MGDQGWKEMLTGYAIAEESVCNFHEAVFVEVGLEFDVIDRDLSEVSC